MIKKEILQDLIQIHNFLANYGHVKGSDALTWGQMLVALSTIAKELEELNKQNELATSEMIEALEG